MNSTYVVVHRYGLTSKVLYLDKGKAQEEARYLNDPYTPRVLGYGRIRKLDAEVFELNEYLVKFKGWRMER